MQEIVSVIYRPLFLYVGRSLSQGLATTLPTEQYHNKMNPGM